MYEIIDRQTGARVGRPYKNRTAARTRADKLDLEYGACRYCARPVQEVQAPINPNTKVSNA